MNVTLTTYTESPVEAIERAAANCYDSTPSDDGRIMDSCYRSGHHSVLEFCDFTFHVEGVSRALTHQLVRSRLASFAQRSQRYCNEDEFEYCTPRSISIKDDAAVIYKELHEKIRDTYKALVNTGVPKEDARFILPNSCCSTIEVKMNLRELIHFMNFRLCSRAQWEIRELAQHMKSEVIKVAPQLERYLVPKCEAHSPYNFCTEHKSCGRHPILKDIFKGESK